VKNFLKDAQEALKSGDAEGGEDAGDEGEVVAG
jgi:hypothetical protein